MAALWKLPVIYVIENNRYAMGTAVARSSAETNFAHRGLSFKIPGLQVDGMDVRAVKAAADVATEWCRSGEGPIILEMQTYRYRGHSMSDPAKYRSKEEVQKMRSEHDPIEQVKARLLDKKWASEDDLKALDKEVRDIVADCRRIRPDGSRAGRVRALDRHRSLRGRDMPIEILMPALSPTMEEGNLAKWLKNEGDKVASGDVIAEIETDKATMEVEAVDEGTLGKILIPAGTEGVKVNTPIAVLLQEGESAGDIGKAKGGAKAEAPAEAKPADAAPAGARLAQGQRSQGRAERQERCADPRRAQGRNRRRPRHSGRHRDGAHHGARSAARRHGRGDAPRRRCLRHGRGGRGVSGRLQDHAGPAAGVRRQARRRHADHRARLCRRRRRRCDDRAEADRRIHDLQLRDASH